MAAKLSKITVTLSTELCKSIDLLSAQSALSRSRLVETYLREHPAIVKSVQMNRQQSQTLVVACSSCHQELGEGEIKISTPKYGLLCMNCWAEKFGKLVEKNPVGQS